VSRLTYRALLVANSTFPADRDNLPELEGPRNDAALLRDALCDDRHGLFPSDNVRLVTEREAAEVLREAEELLRSAQPDDVVLLYYSGHGALSVAGDLLLATRDTRLDRPLSTAVKASSLSDMVEESSAATTVIILDCCYSGRFKGARGGNLAEALAGRGRFVLTSSRGGELADDAHVQNRASMFTHYLVEALRGAADDVDGDGLVGLNEIYRYVHAHLTAGRRQVPERRFAGSGDVAIARRPRRAATGDGVLQSGVEIVDPVRAVPVLDVSETSIDLRDIEVGEELPPERIAVINRGGGELRWTAECMESWVRLERHDDGLVLHLRPRVGVNRANVHVRETRTGMMKTVRIVVRGVVPRLGYTKARPATGAEASNGLAVGPARPSGVSGLGQPAASLEGGSPSPGPPVTAPPRAAPLPTSRPARSPSLAPPVTPPVRTAPAAPFLTSLAWWRTAQFPKDLRWLARRVGTWLARVHPAVRVAFAVLACTTACVAGYLVYAEVQEGRVVERLESRGQNITGTVTDGLEGSYFDVRFSDGQRDRHERMVAGTNSPDYEPGDQVDVLVDGAHPAVVAVEGDTNYASHLRGVVLIVAGFVMILWVIAVVGVGVWVILRRRRRPSTGTESSAAASVGVNGSGLIGQSLPGNARPPG
jgi:hypothetical protein